MLGGAVSLLGVLFVYGGPYDAAKAAGQNTLEAIQGDVVWNPIRFALRLLVVALHPARPHVWVASHYWWFAKPPGSAPEPEIDLSKYAHFQSAVVAAGQPPGVRVLLAVCGLGGLLLVGLALREVRRGGVSRAARLAFPIGGVLLLTILVGAWAAAAQRTLRGGFHQQAPEILVTPELEADARRVAAFAGNENVMLCITRRPGSMTFFVWRRLLYPLRLVPLLPEGIGTGEMDALRERWRARYVLSLGQGSAPIAPGLRRTSWIAPDVLVGEIGDP
jgi:hypothetical protein